MISFTILTTTPHILRDRLVAYGWLDAEFNPRDGLEIVEVPNPIVVTPAVGTPDAPGYVPAVMDARRVFHVKIAHKALEDDTKDEDQTDQDGNLKSVLLRTKFGKALKALGPTKETITLPAASYTRRWTTQEEQVIDGETISVTVPHEEQVALPVAFDAWNVADKLWIVPDDGGRFGTWQ